MFGMLAALLVAGSSVAVRQMTAARASALAAAADTTDASPAFHPILTARLVDTRSTSGGALKSGATLRVQVGGKGGVPNTGVSSVALHVTVVGPATRGWLAVFPDNQTRPDTSNLNYVTGVVLSNSVIVGQPGNGIIDVYASGGPVHVIVDVTGWFGSSGGSGKVMSVRSARLADTRNPGSTGPVGSTPFTVAIAGRATVPSQAIAAVLNVTAVDSPASAPVYVWGGPTRPDTAALHTAPGRAVAEMTIMDISANGSVSLALPTGRANLIVDVLGYVVGPATAPDAYVPVPQVRVFDSRIPASGGPLSPGAILPVQVGGAPNGLPDLFDAVLVSVTLLPLSQPAGYVTAWEARAPKPVISTANPLADAPVAQTAIVAVDSAGKLNISDTVRGDVLVDVLGYFTAATLPPVVPPAASTTELTTPAGVQARGILQTANKFALNTWLPSTAPALLATPMDANQQSAGTDSVRRLSMEAFSLAVSLRTGAYSATVTGISADDARAAAVRIVSTVAAAHMSNRLGGWGRSWQSGMWASYLGRAGWFLWESLSPAQQFEVERMAINEADFAVSLIPKYMVNRAGTVLTPGDSGAEEDSWYALMPALAIAMMPEAHHHSVWRAQQQQLQIAAWARRSDINSPQVVDGRALSSWLGGSNVETTGAVINHSRVAPDYSTNEYQSIDTIVMAALAGQPAPQSALFGLGPVYAALSTIRYTATSKFPTPDGQPSGVIYYSPTSPAVFYPGGCDWGTGQQLPYALLDADAAVFAFDTGAAITAQAAGKLHGDAAAAMQQRSPLGAMYQNATPPEYIYAGREEHTAQLAAQLYLTAQITEGTLTWSVTSQPIGTAATANETRPAPTAGNEVIYRR